MAAKQPMAKAKAKQPKAKAKVKQRKATPKVKAKQPKVKEPKAEGGLVLTVRNVHVAACGPPPALESKPGDRTYTAYFENVGGEQLVFQYSHDASQGRLWFGESYLGWDGVHSVVAPGVCLGTCLDADERKWLALCWEIALAQVGKGPDGEDLKIQWPLDA